MSDDQPYAKDDEKRTNATMIRGTTHGWGSVHGEGRDGSEVSSSVAKKLDGPPTWQEEVASVEDAFDRSGVKSTWPDDEPGNIGPMAAAMADEINRLRLTDEEREAIKEGADALYGDGYDAEAATLRRLLERMK